MFLNSSDFIRILFHSSEITTLEKATAAVLKQFLAPDLKFLPSLNVIALKILLKLPPLIQTNSLSKLSTDTMRSAIGHMISDLEDVLSLTYLEKIKSRSHWHDLMGLLIGEIGTINVEVP